MTTKKSTKKLRAKSTPAGLSDEEVAAGIVAAGIKAILANPSTSDETISRVNHLSEVLAVEAMNSVFDSSPEMLAEHYRQAAPHATNARAQRAKAELAALVEQYAPKDRELTALAHHLSRAPIIARTHLLIPAFFYNELSATVLDYQNREASECEFTDSETHILNVLRYGTSREGGER